MAISTLDADTQGCEPSGLGKVAEELSLARVSPGTVLAGRYRVDHVVPSTGAQRAFIGTAIKSKHYVMLLQLGANVAPLWARALLVSHSNLATLLELIPMVGGEALAVVEYPEGITLKERLEGGQKLPIDKAVSYALGLANALAALHQRGAAHGLLRPASVVLSPQARGGAVLCYAPAIPPPNPFRTPERGLGPPSPADDVWGLAALLHHMLVGRPPPAYGVRSAEELEQAGILDPRLCRLLADCLRPQTSHRVTIVGAVRDALVRWGQGTEPPRASLGKGSSAPQAERRKSAAEGGTRAPGSSLRAESKKVRSVPTLLAGIVAGGLVAAAGGYVLALGLGVFGSDDSGQPGAMEAEAARAPTPSAVAAPPTPPASTAKAAASAAVAATALPDSVSADSLPSGAEVAACVIRQFPEDTFHNEPNFDWLCVTDDPRAGQRRMRSALVTAAGARRLTNAMRLWSRMRWYRMAGFAVVRAACCENAAPLTLPRLPGCEPLEQILGQLGQAVIRNEDIDDIVGRYTTSIKCNLGMQRRHVFRQTGSLGGGQKQAFEQFLKACQEP